MGRRIESFFGQKPEGFKVNNLGPVVYDVLQLLSDEQQCKLLSTTGRKSIFPLPDPELDEAAGPKSLFFRSIVRGLNSMHGDEQFSKGNEASRQVLKRLKGMIEKSAILDEPVPEVSFPGFFKNKGINYFGEEIHVAKKIRWECIAPSLPEQVGTLDIRDFCDAGILHYINNFEDFLIDVEKQVMGKTPSVMVDADQWEPVVEGLLNRGLCKPLPKSELHHIGGRCLLNGMFSVSKQEF